MFEGFIILAAHDLSFDSWIESQGRFVESSGVAGYLTSNEDFILIHPSSKRFGWQLTRFVLGAGPQSDDIQADTASDLFYKYIQRQPVSISIINDLVRVSIPEIDPLLMKFYCCNAR